MSTKKKTFLILPVIFISSLFFMGANNDDPSLTDSSTAGKTKVDLSLSIPGDSVNHMPAVYVVWIEDERGGNIQNIYICNKLLGNYLTGTALPNWKTNHYNQDTRVDSVSGPSRQMNHRVIRDLDVGSNRRFRICLEIDRSKNPNEFFYDRPSYTYKTDLIDLDSLNESYDFDLNGWMSNETDGKGSFSQEPKSSIPGFETFKYMTDISYLSPPNDLVSALSVKVIQ